MEQMQTLYKLIVLKILSEANFSMTNSQLSAFVLEKGYTDYFTLQQTLSDMADQSFLRKKVVRNRTGYSLTQKGRDTLHALEGEMPGEIKKEIAQYVKGNRLRLQNENAVQAEYRAEGEEFCVTLTVQEKGAELIHLTLAVPLEEQAACICDNWYEKSQQIYSYLMRELMQQAKTGNSE